MSTPLCPKVLKIASGGLEGEAANHGDHAFLDYDRAKARGPGLGKIPAKPANHGHFALFDHDIAKNSDKPGPVWEKLPRKSPIMAISRKRGDRIGQTRGPNFEGRRFQRNETFFIDQSIVEIRHGEPPL